MASTSTAVHLSSSSTLIDGKAARRQPASRHCITLPTLSPPPLPQPQIRSQAWKTTAYCRRIARNVLVMTAGEAPAVTAETPALTTVDAPETSTEFPDILKTLQEAWDKVEDKYAFTSLAVAVTIALWGSTGLVWAIEKLPLVPGVLELVGIGYTGWFAYRNLVFKPDREALIKKISETYSDVIGSS